jgi:hypothetical protein
MHRGDSFRDIQTISIIIVAVGVFIAAINSIYASREAKQQRQTEIQTRQSELFMNIYAVFNDPTFSQTWTAIVHEYEWTNLDDFLEKYGSVNENPETGSQYWSFARYLEGIGVLVQQGMIDLSLVDELLGRNIIIYWEKYEALYHDMRKRFQYGSTIGDHTEYLYHELKQRQQATVIST